MSVYSVNSAFCCNGPLQRLCFLQVLTAVLRSGGAHGVNSGLLVLDVHRVMFRCLQCRQLSSLLGGTE